MLNTLPKDITIYGYNTDAVYFSSPCRLEDWKVDETNLETIMNQPYKMNWREFVDKNCLNKDYRIEWKVPRRKWVDVPNDFIGSMIVNGSGGSGKSIMTIMKIKMNLINSKILCTSKNNKVVKVLRELCQKFEVDADCHTTHHCLNLDINMNSTKGGFDMTKFDVIIIDEFFTIDKKTCINDVS